MQADYSVELGADDDTLEIPWTSADGALRHFDLRRHPEFIDQITEAQGQPALREFLLAITARSIFASAKCDTWFSREINPEEDIYGATCKFGSYVDLVLADAADRRYSFGTHESLLKELTNLLGMTPEIQSSAEFILRRCFFTKADATTEGFYVTLYVFGYGESADEACRNWVKGMKLVERVLLDATL